MGHSFFHSLATVLILTLCVTITNADKIVFQDTFLPSLEREWWWSFDAPAEAWSREKVTKFNHERFFFRFISGKELLKKLEIIQVESNEPVWQIEKFGNSTWTPPLSPGEYMVRCYGEGGSEKIVVAVTTSLGNSRMPSWTTENATVSHIAAGGIILTPQTSEKPAALNARLHQLTAGNNYAVDLSFGCDKVSELMLRAIMRIDGRPHAETANFTSGVGDGQNWSVNIAPIANSIDITVQVSDSCRLHSVALREIPPPTRRKVVGEKTFNYEPRNSEPEPANPDLTEPVAFQRSPRQVFEDSTPQPFELITELDTFRTPGEYAVWHFAIHNPGQTRTLEELTVSSLKSENGHEIAADTINISHVRFWDYPRGPYTYYNIPELIEPQQEEVLPPDQNCIFWLQSRIPATTPAGVYTGVSSVVCGSTTIELPVRLRVLPFTLNEPTNMVWAAYAGNRFSPQREYGTNLAVRYFKDLADYGVTGFHWVLGREAEVRKFQELRRLAGIKGPVIIYNIWAENEAMRRCGVEKNDRWFENANVRQAFVDYIKEFDGWVRKYGGEGYSDWFYMGHDEPHSGLMEISHWQNRLAGEAGIPTAACVYGAQYVNQLAPWLDISCNSFLSRNQSTYDELMKIAEEKSLKYWYLGGGCYGGQEGGMMPDRLESGFMSYKLGVIGHLSYAFQAFALTSKPDPYDNFTRKSYSMTYPARNPTEDKVSVFTLEWEGIREGIVDYKYMYTLHELEKKAREINLVQEAEAARSVREEILGKLPWRDSRHYAADGVTQTQEFNNEMADKARALIANAILDLLEVLP